MTCAPRCQPATVSARAARALAVMLAAGCATTAPQPGVTADDCVVTDLPAAPSLRIAVLERVDARNAPVPANSAEQLVFTQLYDTLVRIGCDGVPVAGLADSWSASPDRTAWHFRLREGVSFSDGTPLDARTLAEALTRARHAPPFAAVSAAGERDLHLVLTDPQDADFFAQPALAVTLTAAGTGWPRGTGAYRPEANAGGLRLVLRRPMDGAPDTLHLVRISANDPRGALDAGADVLMTSSAAAIEYARLLEFYTVTPLPWSRTYALVARARPDAAMPAPSNAERAALARDAASVGTRAATQSSPGWCDTGVQATSRSSGASTVIAYSRGDDIARGIAERLVALSWPPVRTPEWLQARRPGGSADVDGPLTVRALDAAALLEEMRAGRAMFVVPLHQCVEADPVYAAIAQSGLHATPLVDARDHLLHRDSVGSIIIDGSGAVRFGARR